MQECAGDSASKSRSSRRGAERRRIQHRRRSFDIDSFSGEPDLNALSTYAESLRDRQETLGLLDADTTLRLDKPELRVEIDRAAAADLRVDPEANRYGGSAPGRRGREVSRFKDPSNNEDYKVQLRLREEDRADPGTIGRLVIPREGGGVVQLESVTRIERVPSASRIDRLDRSARFASAPRWRPDRDGRPGWRRCVPRLRR